MSVNEFVWYLPNYQMGFTDFFGLAIKYCKTTTSIPCINSSYLGQWVVDPHSIMANLIGLFLVAHGLEPSGPGSIPGVSHSESANTKEKYPLADANLHH